MKMTYSFWIFASILFLSLGSCKLEEFEPNSSDSKVSDHSLEEIKNAVCQLGFSTDQLEICGDHVIVENDIALTISSILPSATNNEAQTRNYVLDDVPGTTNTTLPFRFRTTTIYYKIHQSIYDWETELLGSFSYDVSQLWVDAINLAAYNWSNIPHCNIQFVNVDRLFYSDPPIPNLTFFCDNADEGLNQNVLASCLENLSPGIIGKALFPMNGKVGNQISFSFTDPCFNANNTPNPSGDPASEANQACRVEVAMHEIGHILGLRHSNFYEQADILENCFVEVNPGSGLEPLSASRHHIFSTPTEDYGSLMYSELAPFAIGPNPDDGFNEHDIYTAQALYPTTYSDSKFTVNWNYDYDDDGEYYEYFFYKFETDQPLYNISVRCFDQNGNYQHGTHKDWIRFNSAYTHDGFSNQNSIEFPPGCYNCEATLKNVKGDFTETLYAEQPVCVPN